MGKVCAASLTGTHYVIILLSDITIRKVNITTTSYPLVLIKNGRLIALAVRYIIEPI